MISLKTVFGYLFVSILWGCTNPFIKHAQQASQSANGTQAPHQPTSLLNKEVSKSKGFFHDIKKMVLNFSLMVPFALNQAGSAMFFYLLSTEPVSVASPVCNSLTFLFTALTSLIVFKEYVKHPLLLLIGSLFILGGTVLCLQ